MKHRTVALFVLTASCAATFAIADQDTSQIPFPEGYRSWFHHHSTVNMTGHEPEGNSGIQHVYANHAAVDGLKTGRFADGAVFVVDRFKYSEADNHSLTQGDRKVVAVMVRDAQRYAQTRRLGLPGLQGRRPQPESGEGRGQGLLHVPYPARGQQLPVHARYQLRDLAAARCWHPAAGASACIVCTASEPAVRMP